MKTNHLFIIEERGLCSLNEDSIRLVKNYLNICSKHIGGQYCCELWPVFDKLSLLVSDSTSGNNTPVAFLTWTDFQSFEDILQKNTVASDSLTDSIHTLADNLPKFGEQLNVFWIRDQTWPQIQNNLELFGALKRLSCWHNAHIQLMSMEEHCMNQNMKTWASYLCAETITASIFGDQCVMPAWKGDIRLYPSEGEEPTVMPGFTLISHQPLFPKVRWKSVDKQEEQNMVERIYNNHMDFIAMVDVRDIPSFYISPIMYEICVKCHGKRAEKSKKFLNNLMDHPTAGYIVRLTHGTSWKIVQKGKDLLMKPKRLLKKEDKNWRDVVVDNFHDAYALPDNVQLCGEMAKHNYLLVKGQNNSGDDVIIACLMRNPKQINGYAAHVLTDFKNMSGKDSKESGPNISSVLQSVPLFNGSIWLELESQIQQAQLHILQQWKDHIREDVDNVINVDDVINIMNLTRESFMEQYKKQYGDIIVNEPISIKPVQLVDQKPEYEDPYKQLERLILMYNSSQESRLARFQSNDSLGGLSPPTKGQVLKLNAEEFLKHFDSRGVPKKQKLSTLQVKKTKMNKYDSGEVKESKWPECSHYRYHDIYYNVGKTPEKRQDKSIKLKSWLKQMETCSTCTVQQANSPQAIVVREETPKINRRKCRTSGNKSCVTPPIKAKSSGRQKTISVETPPRSANSVKRRRMQSPKKETPPRKTKSPIATKTPVKTIKTPLKSTKTPIKMAKTPVKTVKTPTKTTKTPIKATKTPVKSTKTPVKSSKTPNKPRKSPAKRSAVNQVKPVEKIGDGAHAESRSQRHRRKLEDAVINALKEQGIRKSEDRVLFKACFQRLYTLSYSFVKDLREYTSLREEMETIASMQAPTVVKFERSRHLKKQK